MEILAVKVDGPKPVTLEGLLPVVADPMRNTLRNSRILDQLGPSRGRLEAAIEGREEFHPDDVVRLANIVLGVQMEDVKRTIQHQTNSKRRCFLEVAVDQFSSTAIYASQQNCVTTPHEALRIARKFSREMTFEDWVEMIEREDGIDSLDCFELAGNLTAALQVDSFYNMLPRSAEELFQDD